MSAITVLAIIEADTLTGPAKNLLRFARIARNPDFASGSLPQIRTTIVTFDRGRDKAERDSDFVRAARESGIDVDIIRERFRYDWSAVAQLRDIVKRRQPQIIQSHMIKSHAFVRVLRKASPMPWVAFHHGYTATDLKMQVYNQLNRWSLPAASAVVTMCGAFARDLTAQGVSPERILVQHNGVEAFRRPSAEGIAKARKAIGAAPDEVVILTAGRLSREKGHSDLLEAACLMRRVLEQRRAKIVIAGDGPERARLETAIRQTGMSRQVVLVGHLSDLTTFYGAADVFVLPSYSEGSPNVLLEAMAAGVPIVATNVGGVPEIVVDNESALLVPPRHPQGLADALSRMLGDALLAERVRANAADAVKAFSPREHAATLQRLYRRILDSDPTGGAS